MSIASTVRTKKPKPDLPTEKPQPDLLTEAIQSKLGNPERSSDFDLHGGVNQVLKDVGMSTADSGGKITCRGRDPIIPSPHRFGTMAGLVWPPRPLRSRRCGDTGPVRDRILGWMSARRCGVSAVSSMGNGKPSTDVPRSCWTPRTRSSICHCFAKRGMDGSSSR